MRVVFFGTPDFASRCLERILSSKHQVVGVVTAPDKPKGRGRKVEQSEVKRLAQQHVLEFLQPERLKDEEFLWRLASYRADFFCVVAFRILPEEVFAMPPLGCVNLHASLLPRYRGAAPINWALINGENETGLTTFFIRKEVDTGDLILQEKINIEADETFGELHDRMAVAGGELMIKTMDLIESGKFAVSRQDEALATPAPKLTPELGHIDWSLPAAQIHNLVRGLSPRPGAFTFKNGRRVAILRTQIGDTDFAGGAAGAILRADPRKGLTVACGQGAVKILELKPESGKAMTGAEYARGHGISENDVFGS